MSQAMVANEATGRIEETPLPRLLLALHAERFGGSLTLSRDRVGKRFLFHKGAPVFAESNLFEYHLPHAFPIASVSAFSRSPRCGMRLMQFPDGHA